MKEETVLVDGKNLTKSDIEQKISDLLFVERYPDEQFARWELKDGYTYYCKLIGLSEAQETIFNEYLSQMLTYASPKLKIECSRNPEHPVSIVVVYIGEDEIHQFSQKLPDLAKFLGKKSVDFIEKNGDWTRKDFTFSYMGRLFTTSKLNITISTKDLQNVFIKDSANIVFPSFRQNIFAKIVNDNKIKKLQLELMKNYYNDKIEPGITTQEALPILTELVFNDLKRTGE